MTADDMSRNDVRRIAGLAMDAMESAGRLDAEESPEAIAAALAGLEAIPAAALEALFAAVPLEERRKHTMALLAMAADTTIMLEGGS